MDFVCNMLVMFVDLILGRVLNAIFSLTLFGMWCVRILVLSVLAESKFFFLQYCWLPNSNTVNAFLYLSMVSLCLIRSIHLTRCFTSPLFYFFRLFSFLFHFLSRSQCRVFRVRVCSFLHNSSHLFHFSSFFFLLPDVLFCFVHFCWMFISTNYAWLSWHVIKFR